MSRRGHRAVSSAIENVFTAIRSKLRVSYRGPRFLVRARIESLEDRRFVAGPLAPDGSTLYFSTALLGSAAVMAESQTAESNAPSAPEQSADQPILLSDEPPSAQAQQSTGPSTDSIDPIAPEDPWKDEFTRQLLQIDENGLPLSPESQLALTDFRFEAPSPEFSATSPLPEYQAADTPSQMQTLLEIQSASAESYDIFPAGLNSPDGGDYAMTSMSGAQPWIAMVKDINPGSAGSTPGAMVELNGTIYFPAIGAGVGCELYKSDGTEAGTQLVRDIYVGSSNSNPANLTVVNGSLYFRASDGSAHGQELWTIDETGDAVLLADINPGAGDSAPQNFTDVNGTLYFTAATGTHGVELWKLVDGTPSEVADLNPGTASSSPTNLFNFNGTLYFSAISSGSGRELWKLSSPGGTPEMVDLVPGPTGSSPSNFTNVNGTLYFAINNTGSSSHATIWKVGADGVPTFFVDPNSDPLALSCTIQEIRPMGDSLYLSITSRYDDNGEWYYKEYRLQKIDSAGTATNLKYGFDVYYPIGDMSGLTDLNGTLYFAAGPNRRELWRTDGTVAGTVLVKNFASGIAQITNFNGSLYFAANDGTTGLELWTSDGTAEGTVLAMDINPGSASSTPGFLTPTSGALYFRADDGVHGSELWSLAYSPPTAVAGDYAVDEGGTVQLDGTASQDSDPATLIYEWDFDYDGVTFDVDATGATPSYFAIDGPATKTIALRVTNSSGLTDIDEGTVTIANVAPTLTIDPDASNPYVVDSPLRFVANATDPGDDTLSYVWSLSKDGQPLSLADDSFPDVLFTPDSVGAYDIQLTVTDDDGAQTTANTTVTVDARVLMAAENSYYEGDPLHLIAPVTDAIGYSWTVTRNGQPYDLGGVDVSSSELLFTPVGDGLYQSVVTMTPASGPATTARATVTVRNAAPVVSISGPERVLYGDTYSLSLSTDPAKDSPTTWFIDWGDGTDPDGDGSAGQIVPAPLTELAHQFADSLTHAVISVRATDTDGDISEAVTKRIAIVPHAPSRLLTTTASSSEIDLAWTPSVDTVSGYRIELSTDGEHFSPFAYVPADVATYRASGLPDAAAGDPNSQAVFWFRVDSVRGINGDVVYSEPGNESQAITEVPTPARVYSGGFVDPGCALIDWAAVDLGGVTYELWHSTDGSNFTFFADAGDGGGGSNPEYVTGPLDPDQTHYFKIRTVKDAVTSDFSPVTSFHVPAPPAAPAVVLVDNSLDVVWEYDTASMDGGWTLGVASFEVAVSWDGQPYTSFHADGSNHLGIAEGRASSHVDLNDYNPPASWQTVAVKVRAANNGGWSDYGNIGTYTAPEPQPGNNPGISPSFDAATSAWAVSWNLPYAADVYRNGAFVGSGSTGQDPGLSGNTTYQYSVRDATTGFLLWAGNITTGLDPVASVTATAIPGRSGAQLSWTPVTGAEGYWVGSASQHEIWYVSGQTNLNAYASWMAGSLAQLRVRAVSSNNSAEWPGVYDGGRGTATVQVATTAAPVITGAQYRPDGILVTWFDPNQDVDSFQIAVSPDVDGWHDYLGIDGNARSYLLTGFNIDPGAWFYIVAYHSTGETLTSGYNASFPIAQPSHFNASASGNTSIHLTWDTVPAASDGYLLEKSIDGVSYELVSQPGANDTSFDVTGLQLSTQYLFRIRAQSVNSQSRWSRIRASTLPYGYGSIRTDAGFLATQLPWVVGPDDTQVTSSQELPIGFALNFFGQQWDKLYVNQNGSVSFGAAIEWLSSPQALDLPNTPVIAPLLSDVDRGFPWPGVYPMLGDVFYGQGTVDGHSAFSVTWLGVSFGQAFTEANNEFQMLLIQRSDRASGDFDIEFNYDHVNWDSLSGIARAAWSNGAGYWYEFTGSGQASGLLDSNAATGLANTTTNSNVTGRHVFEITQRVEMAVDNDRDGKIEFNGQDATSTSTPFLFWLNNNRDVWGGDDYPAAVSADPANPDGPGQLDAQSPLIGSTYELRPGGIGYGTTINPDHLREVAERDLEDFAQVGIRWSSLLERKVTGFRLRLDSADSAMTIRVFASGVEAAGEGALSATSHVENRLAIDHILDINRWAGKSDATRLGGKELTAGGTGYVWFRDGTEWDRNDITTDGPSMDRLLQLLFEGVSVGTGENAGLGQLVIELLSPDGVVASSSVDLRLRPMDQLYDHYTVAYGNNVNPDGTFKDVDVLDQLTPVETDAHLVGENQERARILGQSQDYFLFVHGWRMLGWERTAFAESAYKQMFWSGYKGQFGMFEWPTQSVERPAKDAGNFDRSEFVAWNSATGLANALHDIRDTKMTPGVGKLSVMAHSMGNIVLSEALYQNEAQGHLVDTAIMSQAAISSHYYTARTDLLPSIYVDVEPGSDLDMYLNMKLIQHSSPAWTEYRGFNAPGCTDVIGGLTTPRFRGIASAAGKILNYYNPDDFALAGWKYDQAYKPTAEWSNPLNALWIKNNVFLGNVNIDSTWADAWDWLGGRDIPGFANTDYRWDAGTNQFQRLVLDAQEHLASIVPLTYPANKYEMFAFGASSVVAAVGGVDDMGGLGGVFDVNNSQDLRDFKLPDGSTRWNNKNTGHSAQFVGSYLGVKAYWDKLTKDIQ